jgi:hypothetical protein
VPERRRIVRISCRVLRPPYPVLLDSIRGWCAGKFVRRELPQYLTRRRKLDVRKDQNKSSRKTGLGAISLWIQGRIRGLSPSVFRLLPFAAATWLGGPSRIAVLFRLDPYGKRTVHVSWDSRVGSLGQRVTTNIHCGWSMNRQTAVTKVYLYPNRNGNLKPVVRSRKTFPIQTPPANFASRSTGLSPLSSRFPGCRLTLNLRPRYQRTGSVMIDVEGFSGTHFDLGGFSPKSTNRPHPYRIFMVINHKLNLLS